MLATPTGKSHSTENLNGFLTVLLAVQPEGKEERNCVKQHNNDQTTNTTHTTTGDRTDLANPTPLLKPFWSLRILVEIMVMQGTCCNSNVSRFCGKRESNYIPQ